MRIIVSSNNNNHICKQWVLFRMQDSHWFRCFSAASPSCSSLMQSEPVHHNQLAKAKTFESSTKMSLQDMQIDLGKLAVAWKFGKTGKYDLDVASSATRLNCIDIGLKAETHG